MYDTLCSHLKFFFFFNDTATTEIYTLSLHDALPISGRAASEVHASSTCPTASPCPRRSEEHTSELHSRVELVCRLLLEKKKSIVEIDIPLKIQNFIQLIFQLNIKT